MISFKVFNLILHLYLYLFFHKGKITVTNEKRKIIIESCVNGYCVNQVSKMLNVKYSTAYAIISNYQKEDRIEQKLKGEQGKQKRKRGSCRSNTMLYK